MPLPVAIVIAGIVLSVMGAGYSAYSSYSQGMAASRQAARNALVAKRNADLAAEKARQTRLSTELEADKFRRSQKQLMAAQTVAMAKSGIRPEGSSLYVIAETERQFDIDALAIKYAGDVETSRVLAQEAEQRIASKFLNMQSSDYNRSGLYSAGGSLLSGLGNTASTASLYYGNAPKVKQQT